MTNLEKLIQFYGMCALVASFFKDEKIVYENRVAAMNNIDLFLTGIPDFKISNEAHISQMLEQMHHFNDSFQNDLQAMIKMISEEQPVFKNVLLSEFSLDDCANHAFDANLNYKNEHTSCVV